MAGQEDPVQREIHQDWANREYIEVITSSIKKIADFLNSFGQRASRGRRDGGRILRQLGGGAERLRRDSLWEPSFPAAFRFLFRPHLFPPSLTLRLHWVVLVRLSCSRLSFTASLPSPRIH